MLESCLRSLSQVKTPKAIPEIFQYSYIWKGKEQRYPQNGDLVRKWLCQLISYINSNHALLRAHAVSAFDEFLQAIPQTSLQTILSQADPQERVTSFQVSVLIDVSCC